MKTKYFSQGFTLIELAMALLIMGLLLSSFLAPLAARVEQKERNSTQIQLDEIESAIYGYMLRNNYLPCPDCTDGTGNCAAADGAGDSNDGEEDLVTVAGADSCATDHGNLPWVTLGVRETDEWNNRFTYHVTTSFADRSDSTTDGTACGTATLDVSFSLCSDGDITVFDSATGSTVADTIPAIIVSYGKNFVDSAPSTDESENIDIDASFVDKVYSSADGNEFDDMLIWISPHVLRTMSVKGGILP